MDQNGSKMWSNLELEPAVLIPHLYEIGQKKNEYKTKVEFHYKKLLESCGTGDTNGVKQSHYRVQVFGNDYFTWYFLFIDKLDSCGHIEQLEVPALRMDARSEAITLRVMIDYGQGYYDQYVNESGSLHYAEPNLSDDSMHMWWYINFTDPNLIALRESILEEGEYMSDNSSELGNPPSVICDGLSDCESESCSLHEPHMDSPSENGCDTAVRGLKAGSMVIIEYLQTKIATLHNELDALRTPDSRIDGFALYEELWLSHKLSQLNEMESFIELQKLSSEIISRLQRRIGDMEMELMLLRALNHYRSVSDTHLENNGESYSLCESDETKSHRSHAGCLVIIEHLQAKVVQLQSEVGALKCAAKDSGYDTQFYGDMSSPVDNQIDSFSPVKVLVTPEPSGAEIGNMFVTPEPPGGEYLGQPPSMESTDVIFSPGASDCDSKAPGKHKMSFADSQMDGIVLQSDRIVLSGSPANNQNINGSVGVNRSPIWNGPSMFREILLPAPSCNGQGNDTPSSGNGKNKWFPNQIGGSNERLKRFTSSLLCLL